jgi:hypothetical protein
MVKAMLLRFGIRQTHFRRQIVWAGAILGCCALIWFNVRGLSGVPVLGLPEYFIFPGNDLVVYLRGGAAVAAGESPYPNTFWSGPDVFHYSPAAALFFRQWIIDPLPFRCYSYLHLFLIYAAYLLAWLSWRIVFRQLPLPEGVGAMHAWLPLWLVYSQWFADQNFLNIYIFLLLLTGLLTLAVLHRQTIIVVLLAVIIAQTKPHYLYPLLLPLLAGHWRFFSRVALGSLVGYGIVAAGTVIIVGSDYGLSLYGQYFVFLTTIAERYPWLDYYLGYNHSWQSILNWLFARQTWTAPLVAILRLTCLLPFVWLAWRWWYYRRTVTESGRDVVALGLALAIHLWAISALDQLWEVTSAIIVFTYLQAVGTRFTQRWSVIVFVPFALLGLAQLIGWRVAWMLELPGDWLDITAQLPVMMVVSLGLYGLTLAAIWSILVGYSCNPKQKYADTKA